MQNAGASLLTAAVRKTTPYDGASVALMQEFGKVPLIFAAFFYFQSRNARRRKSDSSESFNNDGEASSTPPKETLRGVLRETFSKSALDLAIPSACFAAQNVLYFTALRHLDAATYSLLSQSKTAFTAIFFVTVLGQRLAGLQIIALALLMAGMALVQLGPLWSATAATTTTATTGAATAATAVASSAAATSFAIGSFAVLASSFSSGLANILFEKLVKFKGGSLYAKQLQLGLWTGAFTVAEILRRHRMGGLAWPALTQDWTMGVWGIVCLKSVGGLLVAATIRSVSFDEFRGKGVKLRSVGQFLHAANVTIEFSLFACSLILFHFGAILKIFCSLLRESTQPC
jgi:drug/metabolite transporter (DMT)-like permease